MRKGFCHVLMFILYNHICILIVFSPTMKIFLESPQDVADHGFPKFQNILYSKEPLTILKSSHLFLQILQYLTRCVPLPFFAFSLPNEF